MLTLLEKRVATLEKNFKTWVAEDLRWKTCMEKITMELLGRDIQKELKTVSHSNSTDGDIPDLCHKMETPRRGWSNISTISSSKLLLSPTSTVNTIGSSLLQQASGYDSGSTALCDFEDGNDEEYEGSPTRVQQSKFNNNKDMTESTYDDSINSVLAWTGDDKPIKSTNKKLKLSTPKVLPPNTCRFCFTPFKRPSDLTAHFKRCHPSEKAFQCLSCERAFGYRNHYSVHIKSHTDQVTQKQQVKNNNNNKKKKTVLEQVELDNNVTQQQQSELNKEKTFELPKEQSSLNDNEIEEKMSMEETIQLLDIGQIHECVICQRKFKSPQKMYHHILLHDQGGTVNAGIEQEPEDEEECYEKFCHLCDESFLSKKSLLTHVSLHHDNEKPFKCPFCDRRYFTSNVLERHVENRHSSKE